MASLPAPIGKTRFGICSAIKLGIILGFARVDPIAALASPSKLVSLLIFSDLWRSNSFNSVDFVLSPAADNSPPNSWTALGCNTLPANPDNLVCISSKLDILPGVKAFNIPL